MSTLSPGRKKVRLLEAYLRGRPLWCSWQLTRRCESFCMFCEHRLQEEDAEADLETCRAIAARLGRAGSMIVSLTGGEPFLRPDLPLVVEALAREHLPILTTHGWLVTREKARAVWRAGLGAASVRLDHADPRRFDGAAGLPGAHARALVALDALVGERLRPSQAVNVKTRVRAGDDLEGVVALAGLAAAHGASLTVEPAFPVARGQAWAPAAELLRIKKRHPNVRTSTVFLQRFDAALGEGVPGCRAGRSFFNVDHRGRVSKCVEYQRPEDAVGELPREDLADVLPRLRRAHEENTCRSCWYGSRGEVESLYTTSGLLRALPELLAR